VAWHGAAQAAFARAANVYGFDALQRWQGWAWASLSPLLAVALAVAWKNRAWTGVAAVVAVTLLDLAGTATFVTRAEALHYPIYAVVAALWGPRGALVATMLGVVDETLQWAWLDPVRAGPWPDVKDMGLNLLGALTGLTIGWIRRSG
jgi:hypothetical protein